MKTIRSLALSMMAALGFMLGIGIATPAQAQATRTWVSGVGDDVNPCSRTAPCKTFAGAISKTAAGGEIDCLDPGGYGTLTITKSITIDCTGTLGSVLNSGGINGFILNDSATASPRTIDVKLRGLTIDGAGTTPGLNGIRFLSARSLVVENVFIQNQLSGAGISVAPSAGTAVVTIENTQLAGNGNAAGAGVDVRPTGTGSARVSLHNVQIASPAASTGVLVTTTGTTGTATVVDVDDSHISDGAQGISAVGPANTMMVTNSTVFNNSSQGILGNGVSVLIRVAGTTITANGVGVNPGGGSHINDLGGNILAGNVNNNVFN